VTTQNVLRFPARRLASSEGDAAALRALANAPEERLARAEQLRLEDPELLVSLVNLLTRRWETDPSGVRAEAQFFYEYLIQPKRRVGLMDEREYFLGELALIAGTCSRFLSRREDARFWFDRAEANFRLTVRLQADLSRLAYQRLALRVEERAYSEVLELVEPLQESFLRLGMREGALKCRFLVCACMKELDRVEEAIAVAEEASAEAMRIGDERLYAQAQNNLFLYYADAGDVEAALRCCDRAAKSLTALGNRVGLAKMQFFAGNLLRSSKRPTEALPAYRVSLASFRELGMRGDVAAMHLVIADLLLEQGAEAQAEWEIRAALPIIDEEKMVPEGMAAYALLRESLRRRKIDRNALRDVHGYFQE
jgi:tetratricopeptide (TPR) repeat protein